LRRASALANWTGTDGRVGSTTWEELGDDLMAEKKYDEALKAMVEARSKLGEARAPAPLPGQIASVDRKLVELRALAARPPR
jgi:hypothetical protein